MKNTRQLVKQVKGLCYYKNVIDFPVIVISMEKNLSVNLGKFGLFVEPAPGKKREALNLFVACRLNLPVFWSLLGCINHQKKTSSGRFLSILLPQRKRNKPTNRQTNKGFD